MGASGASLHQYQFNIIRKGKRTTLYYQRRSNFDARANSLNLLALYCTKYLAME